MVKLSSIEEKIAELYCHGYIDKEISDLLDKPIWTVRTHKKHIHRKLSISTTHELVLYMVTVYVGRVWDIEQIRNNGLSFIFGEEMKRK